jgi:hypothetical protein
VTLRGLMMRIPARPLLAAIGLAVLVGYFVCGLMTHRLAGWWFVLGLGAGLGLFGLAILRAAWCAATLKLPWSLRAVGDHADRFVFLLVINLIIVSALSPILRIAASGPGYSISHGVMVAAGALSADVLLIVFVAGVVVLGWVLLLMLLRGTIGRAGFIRALGRGVDWLVVAVLILFCAASMAVMVNGALSTPRSEHVRAEVADVSGVELPFGLGQIAWAELRGYPSGGLTERILLSHERDEIWPQSAPPGVPVVVLTATGIFGVKWVQAIKVDEEIIMLRALAAVPTATAFRKAAIASLRAERRWAELRAQVEAHLRVYPNDRAYALTLVRDLERAGQPAEAAALKAVVQP